MESLLDTMHVTGQLPPGSQCTILYMYSTCTCTVHVHVIIGTKHARFRVLVVHVHVVHAHKLTHTHVHVQCVVLPCAMYVCLWKGEQMQVPI